MSTDFFSTIADSYARYRPGYPPALYAFLAAHCRRRRLAWDCATGNGQAACGLAAHFDLVVGTDLSLTQLSRARRSPRVVYAASTAERSPFAEASVDLVTVAQALHWFELPAFYSDIDHVLADDGLLAIWSYQLLRVSPAVDSVVDRLYHEIVGPFWPPQRALIEQGYGSLPFPYREIDCPTFTMAYDWSLERLIGYLGSWSASQRYREAHGEDPVRKVATALGDAWGDAGERRAVRWPLILRAGRRPARNPRS